MANEHVASDTAHAWPTWLVTLGSLLIAGHLAAVLIAVLAAPIYGPTQTPMGWLDFRPGPRFATSFNDLVTGSYLQHIKLAHHYHFVSHQPDYFPEVSVELRLKDAQGNDLDTVRFPDPNAN